MILGAAFCPHPPALLPAVAEGAAGELADVRDSACAAIAAVAANATRLVLIGAGTRSARYRAGDWGSMRRFGVDIAVDLGAEPVGPAQLPLSLTIGAWLVRQALGAVGVEAWAVGPDASAGIPAIDELASAADVALVVMGDGSARRSLTAPGYLDERAAAFDADVAAAIAGGDPAALRDIDADLGTQLLAEGVPAWHAAGALLAGRHYAAQLLVDAAPYGVGYFVGHWTAAGRQ